MGKNPVASRNALIVLLFATGCQFAPALAASEAVRFATVDFAPYALSDGKGERRGLIVEINATIAARAGVTIVDSVLPIARVLKNLQRGVSDCAVFLLSPWSNDKFVAVAEVYGHFDSVVVTRKGLPIARIEDLHGKLLALPRGSYTDFPIATDPNICRHRTNGYAQSARLLQAGRVDAIAGTALSIYHYLATLKMSRVDIGGILAFDRKPIWLQCAPSQVPDELVMAMRQATNLLRGEGAFRRLFDRYVPAGFK